MNASDLWIGAHVQRADGNYGVVQSIGTAYHLQPMFNLTVDVVHTFFVGGQQWLVHNGSACDPPPTGLHHPDADTMYIGQFNTPSGVSNYVDLAEAHSAAYFSLPDNIKWPDLPGEAWNTYNKPAIEYAVSHGMNIVMVTPDGGYFTQLEHYAVQEAGGTVAHIPGGIGVGKVGKLP